MIEYFLFVIGVILLIKGADYLIEGASSLAKKWNIPDLVIGLTIVAFGTSAPELFINLIAAFSGDADIAIGNIVGSNISNILLVLGVMLLISSVVVRKDALRNEIPFSFIAALILLVFAVIPGSILSRAEGIILFLLFLYFMYRMFKLSKEKHKKIQKKRGSKEKHIFLVSANILGGVLGLFIGGRLVVDNAILIASKLGLSEYVIALTIVAIGTSLPELVTTVVAVLKKQADIGIGNIVGSNIFNILWVLGLTAMIRPITFPSDTVMDITVLLIATTVLFLFAFTKKRKLTWIHGIIFILMYLAYIALLIIR